MHRWHILEGEMVLVGFIWDVEFVLDLEVIIAIQQGSEARCWKEFPVIGL
jgi:hypothetical protein